MSNTLGSDQWRRRIRSSAPAFVCSSVRLLVSSLGSVTAWDLLGSLGSSAGFLAHGISSGFAVVANRGNKAGLVRILCTTSEKDSVADELRSTQSKSVRHTTSIQAQLHKACTTDSEIPEHRGQQDSRRIFLFSRFSLEGSEFVQAFQRKCFILPGTFNF
nr:hypothetical protein CFP56_52928 [Quercus suber]